MFSVVTLPVLTLLASLILGSTSQAQVLDKALDRNLEFIQNVIQSEYAPAEWKKAHFGWDLDTQVQLARTELTAASPLTLKSYQRSLVHLFNSMKDYHTSIRFWATEAATLPFSVMDAGGKYFFVYIDRSKLPETTFPFQVGDELVTFGDQSVADAVANVEVGLGGNTKETDHALAQMYLTSRSATRGLDVPKGPITVGVRRGGNSDISKFQLIWDYTPEQIKAPAIVSKSNVKIPQLGHGKRPGILDLNMVTPHFDYLGGSAANPFGLGGRVSYIPELGPKIWESGASSQFYAYIYQTPAPERRNIGYIRIASYVPENETAALAEFGTLISRMQKFTDALVIDQINNPGGSVFYLYGLASMLSNQPLHAPLHRVTINQESVNEAVDLIKQLDPAKVTDEDTAKSALGDALGGYPASLQVARFVYNYAQFIKSEWEKGHTFSDATYLYGVEDINPSNVAQYTKPILLVINQLDFSGGDFFPTIMQDNKSKVQGKKDLLIFGTRTAGAGGYILTHQYPNVFGIKQFSITGSIAQRVDLNPIENLGVKPDINYAITEDDIKGGFANYANEIKKAVSSLVQ